MSLLASEGTGILVVLAVPALIALLPMIVPRRGPALATAIGLTAVSVLAIASVGIFFFPTVALAWLAATATPDDQEQVAVEG